MEFYLSYAEKEMSILEPLCGSGRFLIPFLEKGYQIKGVDNSREMLEKLKQKAPDSMVEQNDIEKYQTQESFDYIFISSGSVSLFTDMESCKSILSKMKTLLKKAENLFSQSIRRQTAAPIPMSIRQAIHSLDRDFMNYIAVRNYCRRSGWIFRRISMNWEKWSRF